MALELEGLQAALKTHCEALGVFDQTVTADPGNTLASGTVASIMFYSVEPYPTRSGLDRTSAKVKFMVRIWHNATMKPHFNVDLRVMQAAETLIASLHEDIDLGGDTINIEFLSGDNFGAQTGYIKVDEGVYKVIDIMIPLAVADVWIQERAT